MQARDDGLNGRASGGADAGAGAVALQRGRGGTIAMQIYRLVRGRIVAGVYLPQDKLSETELAAGLGVSRTPVREAFGKLEEEGLIAIHPQYGTFVAPVRIDRVAGDEFVREALECAAVRLAAQNCTPGDAARLQDIMAAQYACATDQAFFAADEALHMALLDLAGHAAAWHVLDAAKVNIDRIRHLSARQLFKRHAILREHERIVAAVASGDATAAAAAMRVHLRGVFASSEAMMRLHPEFFQAGPLEARPARSKRKA